MNPILRPSIEPLESRIAPAVIFAGRPGADDIEYGDAPFNPTNGADQISLVVGADPNTYFIRLNPGDILMKYENGYTPFISGLDGAGLKGSVVAFFVDKAHGVTPANGEMDPDELTGMSLGKGVSVQVSGTVDGDVVSNYNDVTKTLGGAAESGGATATDLLVNPITIFAATSVTGKIISGGDISGINATNDVGTILTGRAANGVTYDFTKSGGLGDDTLVVPNVPGAKGVKISNVSIGAVDRIESGAGGAGGVGGDITNVTLISDTNGLIIQAGAGGDGAAAKVNGGKGGSLVKVVVNGLDEDLTDTSANSLITIASGKGGLGIGAGKGGVGGDISDLSIGYELKSGKLVASINALADRVDVNAGVGGDGKTGGTGGKLIRTNILAAPSGAGNNIEVDSGAGGNSNVSGGTAGAGGSITTLDVRNPDSSAAAQASLVHVTSGGGGTTAVGGGKGNNGGLINDVTLIGFSLEVDSGSGSDGSLAGGLGGDIKKVLISDGFLGVRANRIVVDAGHGGVSSAGKGGKGGLIDDLTVLNAELTQFDINQAVGSANGGTGPKGGGAGGAVGNLNINDVAGANEVTMHLRSGNGGSGAIGGSFTGTNVIFGTDASLELTAGAGGGGITDKNGGNGGGIATLTFVSSGTVGAFNVSATLDGGAGGAGDNKGAGGAGGGLKNISLLTDGAIDAATGVGGAAGAIGGAGAGGNVSSIFGQSRLEGIVLTASSAGAGGVKAGAGGGINVANLRAAASIAVTAGNGSGGGAGGSVIDTSFSDVAGTGAGNGGNITGLFGYLGMSGVNTITAGTGAAVAAKASNGGSISDVNIFGGGGVGAQLQIDAGDAVSSTAKKGGLGGNVKGVAIDDLAVGTIVQRISAGSGGDSTFQTGVGGTGGSVTGVQVDATIGIRSGQGFGFNTMGGIFAGQAGLSGPTGKAGVTGSVLDISADAIASIVAGKPGLGDAITARNLVKLVDSIYLNDSVASVTDANGKYLNFATANIIGGVVNPNDPGVPYDPDNNPATPPVLHPHANTFDTTEYGDTDASLGFSLGDTITANTDGFVAAVIFNSENSNVAPEAVFTTDPADGIVKFIDLNNTNGQKVVL
jgi:hypothetical protein